MSAVSRQAGIQKEFAALIEGAAAFGLSLDAVQLQRFSGYLRLLSDWNRRFNLTAVSNPADVQIRHFLDSLSCATITGNLNGQRLVDVGSGAGFPGLPLKILYPELTLTLVESQGKKAGFLEAVIAELALDDVLIEAERVETLGRQAAHRGRYDWAAARAVAGLAVLAEYLLPLCRIGGRALAMKGKHAADELPGALPAIQILGGGPPALQPIRLPGRDDTRYLVAMEKIGETPELYPRRPGIPAKRPL